ncbi:MAG: cell division protein ZapB [Paludibacteraceae bacterium]|nr:cell division protein ZapB [Paludibacteraceae bacterium]
MKKQRFIANPLYDSVFKFLMEDEIVARTLLSALLKKEIVSVEMRPNEYSNREDGRVSIFRIDFGAIVREENGEEHLILIEVQKSWRSTEITRFRQYLGTQYENKRNVDANGKPLPIVSVYILGHKVGKITEPVIYVSRKYLDYDSNEIKIGVPDPFIERLTHNSIIVQVPYLRRSARNRVEKIMSIFDQTYIQDGDSHYVSISGRDISEDAEMKRIINRLATAAVNPDIRMIMNIEDEIFSELESLDAKIITQKKALLQKDEELSQKNEELSQKDEQLAQQSEELSQKDELLFQQRATLRCSVNLLLRCGKTPSEIAEELHLDIKQIMEILQTQE